MNRQIVQLFGLSMILFATLIAFTSRWTVFEADALKDPNDRRGQANKRELIAEQQIPRGLIKTADGTVVARSLPRGRGEERVFTRTYPEAGLFAHAVGYSFIQRGSAGIEQSRNDALVGEENEFGTIFSELQSEEREGRDVISTLDTSAQKIAAQALGGQAGSVVAVEPQTGRVKVMVSLPEYDPNQIPDQFGPLASDEARPLFNRATQSSYPPGSTFKVVTAAAALDSGKFTPDSVVDGSSPRTISGAPLANSGGADFGPITLTEALTNSVNTVWAQVGEQIGPKTLLEYMNRFGFNRDPQLDYPAAQMLASGVRNAKGDLVDETGGFDIGRVAIGQGGEEGTILVSPLQMALVACAVGNGGELMRPRLTERIVGKDGRVDERLQPVEQSQVMKRETAEQLAGMMNNVVNEGTGTAAALEGIDVAGKTGTAEVDNATSNQAWFIGFAPVQNPRMAVAVTIERTQGQGGTEAAPIAKQVLQELLQ
ncbi:MAG: penicillin-binding transpeptidase domain-containing protein [Actinomycetota bacterium]